MLSQKCRHFNGYKPCDKNPTCDQHCPRIDIARTTILIVHLGAMGAVLRSTSLLAMIKRKYPSSYVTWMTEDHTRPLLENNPYIDRILGMNSRDQLILSGMEFDIGYFIDKSPEIGGLRRLANPDLCYGFSVDPRNGSIIPAQPASVNLWEIGLSNQKKFFENKKTEQQLVAEALELPYLRDEYICRLTSGELALASVRANLWSERGQKILVGLNTGTSGVLQNKTIPIETWRTLIHRLQRHSELTPVLLGGPSDRSRNEQIAHGLEVIQTPTDSGLRDGLCSVQAVDMVVTGDSLGMHMAIALKKPTLVWFGPTCAHEIDLYGRGEKILSAHSCSPCWKRICNETVPCNEMINLVDLENKIKDFAHRCRNAVPL